MFRPPEIVFRNVDPSAAVESAIRERIQKLAERYPDLLGCTVTVESPNRRGHKGHLYFLRIDLSVRGDELVVNRTHGDDHAHEDIYVAVRDAFDALTRQVERYENRRRREVKRHEAPPQGRVARLFESDGYGFIGTPDGRHVYFHRNALLGEPFDQLAVGDAVEFVEVAGDDGPQASTVRRVGPWRATQAGVRL